MELLHGMALMLVFWLSGNSTSVSKFLSVDFHVCKITDYRFLPRINSIRRLKCDIRDF